MIDQIADNLFRIVVPLPDSPLKEINSYVIRSEDRNLVIDTGMNRPECEEVLVAGLDGLGIDRTRTDFLATHMHADHQGLISTLMTPTSRAFMGDLDTPSMRGTRETWSKDGFMGNYAGRSGFPARELEASMQNHPGFKYSSSLDLVYEPLRDGDEIEVGDFRLQVIHTPGHTNGHICLYEPGRRLLFSGDHVLGDITPNIASWSEEDHPLEAYLDSLDRVAHLEVELCLPGHRSLITDYYGRLDALKRHHFERANEVLEILDGRRLTAYDIAREMTWSIRARSWDEFPLMQRWFATGEAIAHIHYVEGRGLASRSEDQERIYYQAGSERL